MVKKCCPAVVVMLRVVLDMKHKDIVSETGYKSSAVGNIISRHCPQSKHKDTDKHTRRGVAFCTTALLDKIEAEYLSGKSTYELAEKYGVRRKTICKWMKKRGHARGKGWCCKGGEKGRATQLKNAIEKIKTRAFDESKGTVEFVEWHGNKSTFHCLTCNAVFDIWAGKEIHCPCCRQKEVEKKRRNLREKRAIEKQLRDEQRAKEYAKEKHCCVCGALFHSTSSKALYCGDTCSRRAKYYRDKERGKKKATNHRKRARRRGAVYESGITLDKLIERDSNICQICGEPCDINDKSWGCCGATYPSIDHIVPLAKGGSHTWENVQLAHMICNSKKRDLLLGVDYAEEYSIANECA